MNSRPVSVALRTYQIGFGDCFLLTVGYSNDSQRHCLIDFGSTRYSRGWAGRNTTEIAEDIKVVTGGKLDVVVASHRHKDHISGFAGKSGAIIAALEPQLVVQPWTEDPAIEVDASAPIDVGAGNQTLVQALASMQNFALHVQQQWMDLVGLDRAAAETDPGKLDAYELERQIRNLEDRPRRLLGVDMPRAVTQSALQQLLHLGLTNISNAEAVKGLIAMAEDAEAGGKYCKFGDRIDLRGIMPGVKVSVLGPPTVSQWPSIKRQRHRDPDEFWHMRSEFWQAHAASQALAAEGPLFDDEGTLTEVPFPFRWAVPKAQAVRVDQLLAIVRALDTALNNTSLILVFEIGEKTLLFPGDAQIENWEYVLHKARGETKEGQRYAALLRGVDLYKVGHHGSLNATPKTLWNMFEKRSRTKDTPDRMTTVMSSLADVHGSKSSSTEVPRRTLVTALKQQTDHHSTQMQRKKAEYVHIIEMAVR